MSVETESGRHGAAELDTAAAVAAADNPVLLGVPSFIIGTAALGMLLIGYQAGGAAAALLSIFVLSSATGLLVAAIWAIRAGAGPVAAVFGIFQGFFFTFATLQYGLAHDWFGTGVDAASAVATFALCWLFLIVVLTVATLRLPLLFTVLFVLVDIAFALVFLAYNGAGAAGPSATLLLIAGIVDFVFTLIGVYLFIDAMGQATGGKPMPLGAPMVS
ncbi:GPR1/FUN34/YaaH family transporter [uncultured Pseudonocardia sp.]|uniref:GPR1/FUN34/YaaH family transporter n=1 Tax=uncultured Pseudonocardia sp. TaxID=211455 RepID=UPI0026185D0A|nr:GPR1/FUN34/YaaH family transporter [uncultured Pseudonocardia sp.]